MFPKRTYQNVYQKEHFLKCFPKYHFKMFSKKKNISKYFPKRKYQNVYQKEHIKMFIKKNIS